MTNLLLCLLGTALVLLAKQFVAEHDRFAIGFDGVSLLSVAVYLGAVLLVRTQPVSKATFGIVIGFAVAMHAVTYFALPFQSTDMYRYVWDGIVQHAHVNPYRYVPGNAALSYLRKPNQAIFDKINRRDYAPTIYPPVAQMMFWLATFFSPTLAGMKMLMLGFEALAGWAVVQVLKRMGRPRAEVLLLLWCPLLVWEIAGGGHVDAIVIGFVSLALLYRMKGNAWLTGLFLGCAVMTKFYPLVLFPALYQRRDWKMPATVVAVCVAGYAVYASVGKQVFGFLSGYSEEEGLNSGERFFLLEYVRKYRDVPNGAFLVFSALVLGGICVWAWVHATAERCDEVRSPDGRTPNFVKACAMLALAMMLLFSPHYAWYVVWLVPFMALAPSLPLYVYVLGFFYGFTTALADPGPKMFLLNERLYGAVTLAMLLHLVARRWPVWQGLLGSAERERESSEASVN